MLVAQTDAIVAVAAKPKTECHMRREVERCAVITVTGVRTIDGSWADSQIQEHGQPPAVSLEAEYRPE